MEANVSELRTDLQGLDDLAPLWKELHHHHREVSAYKRLVEDVNVSWEHRERWYRRLLAGGAAYLIATDHGGRVIGYVMVAVEDGPDDTFEVDGGIAEVVTLVVARDRRSAGVGRALLAAAEGAVRRRGIDTVKIAVMSGNSRAQEFYEAQGYLVGEHVLYRRLGDR